MVVLLKPQPHTEQAPLPIDQVVHGDCLAVLKMLPSNSVDALVCDPPSSIRFMGQEWDSDKGGSIQWIAWLADVMREALRIVKPGGHGLIWALPRTSYKTGMALEEAGWEVRDCITHLFGTGFPKSMDVSKAIDAHLGKSAEREVVGPKMRPDGKTMLESVPNGYEGEHDGYDRPWKHDREAVIRNKSITAPATPESARYNGYGTALKPAAEFWWLVRKPLSEHSIAENVLKHGCGGLNIDKCRVGLNGDRQPSGSGDRRNGTIYAQDEWTQNHMSNGGNVTPTSGRFPSHLLLSHSLFCIERGVKRVRSESGGPHYEGKERMAGNPTWHIPTYTADIPYHDADGLEQVPDWKCAPECPIAQLDAQGGIRKSGLYKAGSTPKGKRAVYGQDAKSGYVTKQDTYGDSGTVSRYFTNFPPEPDIPVPFLYAAKASRTERSKGCEGLPEQQVTEQDKWSNHSRRTGEPRNPTEWHASPVANNHPTVKSQQLMKWLVRLVGVPGGIILDPFLGSGSTAVAAIAEGFHFVGIEQSAEYVAIAEARIAHAWETAGHVPEVAVSEQEQEYDCVPECPIRLTGEMSGVSTHKRNGSRKGGIWSSKGKGGTISAPGDTGTAARYFQQLVPDALLEVAV